MPSIFRDGGPGVKGGSRRSFRGPKDGVNGVSGVLGVEIYRPWHFGQRTGSSAEEDETGRLFGLPALLG